MSEPVRSQEEEDALDEAIQAAEDRWLADLPRSAELWRLLTQGQPVNNTPTPPTPWSDGP